MYKEYWNRWQPQKLNLFLFDGEGGGGGGADTKVDDKKDTKVDDKKDTKIDDEPTEEEIAELAQARNLLNVLKNPEGRKEFLQKMMKAEGITSDSSDKDLKKAERSVKSIIKKHLGTEYEVLGSRLENIFNEFEEYFDEKKIKPTQAHIAQTELERNRESANASYDKVFAEYENSKELEKEVNKLSSEILPGEKQSAEAYFRRLLVLAASEKGVTLKKVGEKKDTVTNFNEARRSRNRNDGMSRSSSETTDDGKVTESKDTKLTLDEAIQAGAAKAKLILGMK